MINFTTETESTQGKPNREWTRIDANKEKTKTEPRMDADLRG
jgi:hypothetical protein